MFGCKACVRRLFYTVLAESANTHRSSPHVALSRRHTQYTSRLRRRYATEAILLDNAPTPSPTLDVGVRNAYVPQQLRPAEQDDLFGKTNLGREVRWLKDPLKLGDHTVKLLRQSDPQKALALVRLASKNVQCTVSWNYLIDYHMSKGDVGGAVRLYSEMKKRAQLPDAHTFTTLFRGFSWNPNNSLSRTKALSIYHSMFADNSPIRPSIIHTNAALKFCALAGDIDGLLGIAAKLPSYGKGAADNLTFTTILNGLRHEALKSIQQKKPDQGDQAIRAVVQGRRLWEEIRERWVKGDLLMDEKLVCAMGRLLLLGDNEIMVDNVLSLVEQTTGIRRQVPRVGESGRKAVRTNRRANDNSQNLDQLDETAMVPPEDVQESGDLYDPESDPFAVLANVLPKSQSLIQPGSNTLSLILETCIRLELDRAAQNYWGLLTDPSGPYKIVPDTENYHMYLRLLRIQRASRLSVCLVDDMSQGALGRKIALEPKTFRIGLSCCVRDKRNPNSMNYAAKLVAMMNATLEHPDARALYMYLTLGLSQQPRDWRTLLSILREVDIGIQNLRSLLAYDRGKGKVLMVEIKGLVRAARGAYDVVLDIGNEEMSKEDRKHCEKQRHTLSAYMTRMAEQDNDIRKTEEGRAYLTDRLQRQSQAQVDDVGNAHENVDARGISSRAPARQAGIKKERPIRWLTARRTHRDAAPVWKFTPE